jgi:hypothetical protein
MRRRRRGRTFELVRRPDCVAEDAADLILRDSSARFSAPLNFPPFNAAISQRGFAPRPAHVSPERLRYFGGTFLPFKALPLPRTTPPSILVILSNCCSIWDRCSRSLLSIRVRRSMRASTVIPDRFAFAIVISRCKNSRVREVLGCNAIASHGAYGRERVNQAR